MVLEVTQIEFNIIIQALHVFIEEYSGVKDKSVKIAEQLIERIDPE